MFTVGFKLDTFTVSETGPSSTMSILLAGNFFHNAIHCWHGLSYPCLPYTTLTWIWPHALKLSCTVLSPRWEAPCGPEKYMGKVCACVSEVWACAKGCTKSMLRTLACCVPCGKVICRRGSLTTLWLVQTLVGVLCWTHPPVVVFSWDLKGLGQGLDQGGWEGADSWLSVGLGTLWHCLCWNVAKMWN